ncbi:MAG: DUF3800 domain-containing protein [Burkholderiales bacterium]
MHLLYVDESGSVSDISQEYFVLAGVSVFERQTHWIEQKLNEIATCFNTVSPHELELHGSPMRSGKGAWRKILKPDREQAIKDALQFGIVDQPDDAVRLFGTVVKKSKLTGIDPVVHSFEQITSRFDMFLQRRYTKFKDPQRGLMLFDESTTEQRIQTLAREFKYSGHSYGKTRNYSEVPVFLDSRASRLIQLVDLVAYSIFRHYEHNDSQYFNILKPKFDSEGGVTHGLYVDI